MYCWNMNAWNKNKKCEFRWYSFSHNVRSLPRHLDDIVSDNRIINNDITEAQIKPSDSISNNSNFNNNEIF